MIIEATYKNYNQDLTNAKIIFDETVPQVYEILKYSMKDFDEDGDGDPDYGVKCLEFEYNDESDTYKNSIKFFDEELMDLITLFRRMALQMKS